MTYHGTAITNGIQKLLEKTHVIKRFLLMTGREAYTIYKDEHPEAAICFSRFHELKPVVVD